MPIYVPKNLHFIWVRNRFPEKYVQNIKNWIAKNPDYQVFLWIDSASIENHLVDEYINTANSIGAKVRDIGASDKAFLLNSKNSNIYIDEVTGEDSNAAAASDALRLEILFDEGGVYIDTDIQPADKPLGDIEASHGFVKLSGTNNDVLCSVKHSEMVDHFRDKMKNNYAAIYNTKSDSELNQSLHYHRSIKPWKSRLETTLEWSGEVILPVVDEKYIKPLRDAGRIEEAVKVAKEVFSTELCQKFTVYNDKTWLDKGPKNIHEANDYFKDELKFRLRNLCIREILNLKNVEKNKKYSKDLDELIEKIKSLPEEFAVSDIIKLWKKQKSGNVKAIVESILKYDKKIIKLLNGLYIKNPDTIIMLRKFLFPQSRYLQPTEDINFGIIENILSVRNLYTEMKSIMERNSSNIDFNKQRDKENLARTSSKHGIFKGKGRAIEPIQASDLNVLSSAKINKNTK